MKNGVGPLVAALVLLVLVGVDARLIETSHRDGPLPLPSFSSTGSSSSRPELSKQLRSKASSSVVQSHAGGHAWSSRSRQPDAPSRQQQVKSSYAASAAALTAADAAQAAWVSQSRLSDQSGPSDTNGATKTASSSSAHSSKLVQPISSTKSSSHSSSSSFSYKAPAEAADTSDSVDVTSNAAISSSSSSSSSGGGSGAWAQPGSVQAAQPSRRHLQQSALCPEGCAPGFCVPGGVDPSLGFKCQQCLNNLMVDKATGKCACPSGRFSKTANSCSDCPKGSYCDGGVYQAAGGSNPVNLPTLQACGSNMTTLGLRSTSIRSCVNLPGTYYTITSGGVVGAVTCPVNTYGPGLKKQRACVPCPPNYVTNGKVGQQSPTQCIIPPGYYLKAPGVIAPCPQGEWTDGTGPAGNCSKCAFGATTVSEASTSAAACTVLLPGYYAATMSGAAVTSTAVCPQKYYCPGGTPTQVFNPANPAGLNAADPTIKLCPSQTWTQERGAVSPEQCLTPPGHYTSGGQTLICPDGWYRADWLPASQATVCTACGVGVQGDKSDRVSVWNLTTGALSLLPIMSSSGDCFIQPGQGLFYSSISQTYRARNCDDNTYGVPTRFYGLTAFPCRPCPTGLVTSNNTVLYPNSSKYWRDHGDGTRGFTSELACVTQDGWGYASRLANQCPVGSYNPRDTYAPCTACPMGRTTAAVGAGATLADCGIAAGYGAVNGAVAQCPIGTYNAAAYTAGTSAACTSCDPQTTTSAVGATASTDCNLCEPGYGGANCATPCGGMGACPAAGCATFGDAGRAVGTACTACLASATGYSFLVEGTNDLFAPRPVSPSGAASAVQCFTEYAQMEDTWWLPTSGNTGITTLNGITSFGACVDACTADVDCQYVTYDYSVDRCYVRKAINNGMAGTPYVGFKAVPSSDVGRSWSLKAATMPTSSSSNSSSVRAKTASSGQYTWWLDSNWASIGYQSQPADVSTFTTIQDCLDACDDAGASCAGVVLRPAAIAANTPKQCMLIRGDTTLGATTRSMTRTVVTKMALPPIV